ncbi:MAG TPA: LysR family transcriptional regulator [Acidimicrobiales bacterium]|nr:LysR family transcriptional regulator [Acidimicrobiales bacterium]
MPLPQPLPDVGSLDLLLTIAGGHSISEAAEMHGMTQPAASQRLRTLERVLGVSLLRRSRAGATLTPAGEATVEWARRVVDDVRALLATTAALRSDARAHLRVAASMTVAEYLVPAWLQALGATRPDITVSLQMGNTAQVRELVVSGEADLGFVEGRRSVAHLAGRDVVGDDLVVVVGASHPWRRRRRALTPSELAATPLVLREVGSGTREVLVDALADLGLEPKVLVELGSTTAIKSVVATGTAPAVLSSLAVAEEIRSGQLVVVDCPGLALQRTVRAVWPERRVPSAAAQVLLDVALRR